MTYHCTRPALQRDSVCALISTSNGLERRIRDSEIAGVERVVEVQLNSGTAGMAEQSRKCAVV